MGPKSRQRAPGRGRGAGRGQPRENSKKSKSQRQKDIFLKGEARLSPREKKRRNAAAKKIQRAAKQAMDRLKLLRTLEKIMARRKDLACIKIQTQIRMFIQYKKRQRRLKEIEDRRRALAASRIQTTWRCFSEWRHYETHYGRDVVAYFAMNIIDEEVYQIIRDEYNMFLNVWKKRRNDASIIIQAYVRKMLARILYWNMIEEADEVAKQLYELELEEEKRRRRIEDGMLKAKRRLQVSKDRQRMEAKKSLRRNFSPWRFKQAKEQQRENLIYANSQMADPNFRRLADTSTHASEVIYAPLRRGKGITRNAAREAKLSDLYSARDAIIRSLRENGVNVWSDRNTGKLMVGGIEQRYEEIGEQPDEVQRKIAAIKSVIAKKTKLTQKQKEKEQYYSPSSMSPLKKETSPNHFWATASPGVELSETELDNAITSAMDSVRLLLNDAELVLAKGTGSIMGAEGVGTGPSGSPETNMSAAAAGMTSSSYYDSNDGYSDYDDRDDYIPSNELWAHRHQDHNDDGCDNRTSSPSHGYGHMELPSMPIADSSDNDSRSPSSPRMRRTEDGKKKLSALNSKLQRDGTITQQLSPEVDTDPDHNIQQGSSSYDQHDSRPGWGAGPGVQPRMPEGFEHEKSPLKSQRKVKRSESSSIPFSRTRAILKLRHPELDNSPTSSKPNQPHSSVESVMSQFDDNLEMKSTILSDEDVSQSILQSKVKEDKPQADVFLQENNHEFYSPAFSFASPSDNALVLTRPANDSMARQSRKEMYDIQRQQREEERKREKLELQQRYQEERRYKQKQREKDKMEARRRQEEEDKLGKQLIAAKAAEVARKERLRLAKEADIAKAMKVRQMRERARAYNPAARGPDLSTRYSQKKRQAELARPVRPREGKPSNSQESPRPKNQLNRKTNKKSNHNKDEMKKEVKSEVESKAEHPNDIKTSDGVVIQEPQSEALNHNDVKKVIQDVTRRRPSPPQPKCPDENVDIPNIEQERDKEQLDGEKQEELGAPELVPVSVSNTYQNKKLFGMF
jgi:hypothetical protein